MTKKTATKKGATKKATSKTAPKKQAPADAAVAALAPKRPRAAFVAVIADGGWKLGLAEEGVAGYKPFPDDHDYGGFYKNQEHARTTADECNKRLGLTPEEAFKIAASSVGESMKETAPPPTGCILNVGKPGEKGRDERLLALDDFKIAHGYVDMHEGIATQTVMELLDNWTSQIHEGGWEGKLEDLLNDIDQARDFVNGALDRLIDHLKATRS